ncbi:MAG: protein-glutamate methylesterase/protein-glutamine glutaminase [bacterium]
MTIKVLVIDDSALVRQLLTEILNRDAEIEVVGAAPDPMIARTKIKQLNPDVLTLDVEMPKMDGVSFLRNLMRLRPMPVVMVSTLTEQGADVTIEALSLGAVDFIAKPKTDLQRGLDEYADELIRKVKNAAKAQVQQLTVMEQSVSSKPVKPLGFRTTDQVIAIGASAGGTEALKVVLSNMPVDAPGVVITLHIPPVFSKSFADRMNTLSPMEVAEAQDGQQILPGHVYVAPGDRHMEVVRDGAMYRCSLKDGPVVCRHKPSVDVLFRSVAKSVGKNAIAAMLTGMGVDGSEALGEIQKTGAPTIIQDEATCVVWGMPGEAARLGHGDEILPLQKIAPRLVQLAAEHARYVR